MYTCPMHPEVVSDVPGRCPKCGMPLVKTSDIKKPMPKIEDKGLGVLTWKSYMPLMVIVGVLVLVALIVSRNSSTENLVLNFMTGFFIVFASFKLMDLKGFAEGYSTYDLLAGKWFGYGYVYPFIELGFGLLMLMGFHGNRLLWAEVGLMTFSGVGVAIKLWKGEEFMCACLGTFLKVPLTKITVIEDFGMALLALIVLLT